MSWKACAAVKELRADLEPMEKFVLIILAEYHRTDGKNEWPSMNTLAEDCLITERGVQQIVSRLESKGFIKRTIGGGRGRLNCYKIAGVDFKKGESETPNGETVNSQTLNETPHSEAQNPAQPCNPPITPYKELPVKNIPDYKLSPPSSEGFSKNKPKSQKQTNSDPRFEDFVAALSDGYKRRGWDFIFNGADGKQLKSLLAYKRSMNVAEFKKCLRNYFESEGVIPGGMPHTYLMKLPNFWAGPLNQYGKLIENRVASNSQEMVV
jgi:hypothetical protein